MYTIDFTKKGGFPLEQDTLSFMQNARLENMNALVALCGCEPSKSYIIHGVDLTGGDYRTPGWVVMNNEILRFEGGSGQALIPSSYIGSASFENGETQEVYTFKKAVMSSYGTPISQFIRLTNIKDLLSGVPNATMSKKGVIEIATQGEVNAGLRADLAVTPKMLKDGDFVRDAMYVHTDRNFTTAYQQKLKGIKTATQTEEGLVKLATSQELQGKQGTSVPTVQQLASELAKLKAELASKQKVTMGTITTRNRRSDSNIHNELFNNFSYNYGYVYPPSGYTMSDLVGFLPSIAQINFQGDVGDDDVLFCKWKKESTRIKVICNNTENSLWNTTNSKFNYIAVWEKR